MCWKTGSPLAVMTPPRRTGAKSCLTKGDLTPARLLLLQEAATALTGTHDFTQFAEKTDPRPPIKKMRLLRVERVRASWQSSRKSTGFRGQEGGASTEGCA